MTTAGGAGGQAAAMAAAAATAGLFAAIARAEGFPRLAGEEQAGGGRPQSKPRVPACEGLFFSCPLPVIPPPPSPCPCLSNT